MREMWNIIKRRNYKSETVQVPPKDIDTTKSKQQKTETKTMEKKDHIQMIRSLFNIMVHGISHERLVIQMDEAIKKGTYKKKGEEQDDEDVEYQMFLKLVNETFDQGEYRLSLWLPLSLEQKLDMLLHQTIPEECELMQFLIDEEQGCGFHQQAASLKKLEEVDKIVEQVLDGQVFEKNMFLTRIQALNSSLARCKERAALRAQSDNQLLIYAEWLEEKHKNAQKYEQKLRSDIKMLEKMNEFKLMQIADQMKQPKDKPANIS